MTTSSVVKTQTLLDKRALQEYEEKGITYDTGGADIKAGGVMAGMHRDKCGAATVAGFMKDVEAVNPKIVTIATLTGHSIRAVGPNYTDYDFVKGPSEYEDLLQANNQPSTMTARGHQMPTAFMIGASGMDKHGIDSGKPLPYTHLDIAGSSGPYPGVPTANPLVALIGHFVVPRICPGCNK
ncbi:putative aminopeptidase W07G4.4 [Gigantopelta aegis]|uniref:putative aminopeptidase W07G4.4 n=1 Tax=Gigantopelta aegis TaxID=1735272 RepID=UPI001B88B824|nr:putative aminopeptidase W07G4.4 [Gigantopelta aegis]